MIERWRPVQGYEGTYEISNLRRVRSLSRLVDHWRGGLRLWRGQIMKVRHQRCPAGILRLRIHGTGRQCSVNKMMAAAWPEIKTAPRRRRSNRSLAV